MKKIIVLLFCTVFVLNTQSVKAEQTANSKAIVTVNSHKLSNSERTSLINRVNEIRYMEKSKLTVEQKTGLRNELNVIKQKLTEPFTGIYLSAGAIIIILLVLLIILR